MNSHNNLANWFGGLRFTNKADWNGAIPMGHCQEKSQIISAVYVDVKHVFYTLNLLCLFETLIKNN